MANKVLCLFNDCNESFEFNSNCGNLDTSVLEQHLMEVHSLVIDAIDNIAELPEYLSYWRKSISSETASQHCFVFRNETDKAEGSQSDPTATTKQEYLFLSYDNPDDAKLRNKLHENRLTRVLELYQKERLSLEKFPCIFCNDVNLSRTKIFEHLAEEHSFWLGEPDNMVFVGELLQRLGDMITNQICLYCEKEFRTRFVLKEHMRKRNHRRIKPDNSSKYAKYFISAYLKPNGFQRIRLSIGADPNSLATPSSSAGSRAASVAASSEDEDSCEEAGETDDRYNLDFHQRLRLLVSIRRRRSNQSPDCLAKLAAEYNPQVVDAERPVANEAEVALADFTPHTQPAFVPGHRRTPSQDSFKKLTQTDAESVMRRELQHLLETCDEADRPHMASQLDAFTEIFERYLKEAGSEIDWNRIQILDDKCHPSTWTIRKFNIFNTNNLWVSLAAVKRNVEQRNMHMEVIVNPKTLDNGARVLQLEEAVGAAIKNFNGAVGVNVPRSRFLPVKTCSDLLLVMSNLYTLHQGRLTLSHKRNFLTVPLVKLGTSFKKVKDFLSRFENIPDCLELDHLTVSGDVTFGKNVVLKGTVIIIANHGERIDIPAGAILENKIVSGNLRILDH
uniref:UTP--glucose-1-phosphate uridylyltransferase n=1 Tax=Macrostomum lignano TaxID=282301 RepID=A0A1I8IKQ0_9PLAT